MSRSSTETVNNDVDNAAFSNKFIFAGKFDKTGLSLISTKIKHVCIIYDCIVYHSTDPPSESLDPHDFQCCTLF